MIQYVGYESTLNVRTYSFRVIDLSMKTREFRLSVNSESLMEHHFKCQDVPDLCFSKLKQELSSETQEYILPLKMVVSNGELQKYVQDHYPAKRKPTKP